MPCVARKTNKTHHLPLGPCVLLIHVSVAFGADLAAIWNAEGKTKRRGEDLQPTHLALVDLLLNAFHFHRKFRFIFSWILSENAPNVHFGETKFQNFPGVHAPDPPSVPALSEIYPILAGPTLNCFCRACWSRYSSEDWGELPRGPG